MKRILAVLLTAAVSCSLTSVAMAESDVQVDREKNIEKTVRKRSATEKMMPEPDVQLKRLTKGLKLTDDQQKQIRPMLADEYARLKGIRRDENLSPKQIQAKVEELRTETVAKIQTVLTPEQKEKHDLASKEIRANKKQRMQENRKNRLGSQPDPPTEQIVK